MMFRKVFIFLILVFLIVFGFLLFNFKKIPEVQAGKPVWLDKTPPDVSVTGAPTDWQNTDASADITCTDDHSGCDNATYRIKLDTSDPGVCSTTYGDYAVSGPFPYTIDAHYWICGAAKDVAGNIGFSSPVEFKVDKDNPTVLVSALPPEVTTSWQKADATADVSCSDSGGSDCDPATFRLWIDTSDPGVCSNIYADYTILDSELPYTVSTHSWVCAAAKDAAGNTDFSPLEEFFIDQDGPISTILSPDASTFQSPPSFSVTVSDSDTGGSGLDTCYYGVYDTGFGDYTVPMGTVRTPCSTPFNVTVDSAIGDCRTSGNDSCVVYVFASDNAGNNGTAFGRAFSIDFEAPTTTIKCNGAECSSDWYTVPVEITLECNDTLSGCDIVSGYDAIYYCVDQANTCNPRGSSCPP